MIIDDQRSHFIFIYHPKVYHGKRYTVYNGKDLTNGEILQYWGKWIVLGERSWLDEMARKLDMYVEEESVPCVKYDRTPSVNLGVEECVMMVYCDKRQREDVWKILQQLGVKFKAWVSERETMEMWVPGARLFEQWIASQDFDEVTIEAIREDARQSLGHVFDHPDDIFDPWKQ